MGFLFLAVSAAAIAVFGCWRTFVGVVAARPLSSRLLNAAGPVNAPADPAFGAGAFALLERLFAAAGALSGYGRGLYWLPRYYRAVRAIKDRLPMLAPWSEREMAVCSRYLAARVDRLLASNAACSHRVRGL